MASTEDSIRYGRQRFAELGIGDETFFGVVGSLMGESGRSLNTRAFNASDPNGGSIGIAQWHSNRRRNMEGLAARTGRNPDDYTAQWDYIIEELQTTHSSVLEKLRGATTRYDAARIWTDLFERPAAAHANHDGRAANADYVAALNFGGEGGGGPNLTASTSNSGSGSGLDAALNSILGGGGSGQSGSTTAAGGNGRTTPAQGLAMGLGTLVAGPAGAALAKDLFGSGGRPGNGLSTPEAIAMGLGGLLGGVPGALLGQQLGQLIGDIFGLGRGNGGYETGFHSSGEVGSTRTDDGVSYRHEGNGRDVAVGSTAPTTSQKPQSRPDNLDTSGRGGGPTATAA